MPYLFEIIKEIKGSKDMLLEIESQIKQDTHRYTPLISFAGSSTECFKDPIDLDKYLT